MDEGDVGVPRRVGFGLNAQAQKKEKALGIGVCM